MTKGETLILSCFFSGKSKGTVKKTPALLTRTSEERQRIITEKVAMVLMEEVASGEDEVSKEIDVKSTFLQECVDEVCVLESESEDNCWQKNYDI